jgi:parallel beta-helix repeat protein
MRTLVAVAAALFLLIPLHAATYYVDGTNPKAADTNPGTEVSPWKTIARAGKAAELKPGDTVLIKGGVYREYADISVSGAQGRPITFAAAPGARVVIKGSEIIRGKWTHLADWADKTASLADKRTWKITLGDEYFTDKRFEGVYNDKSRRWVSQVFWDDDHPLQMIGPDGIYKNETMYSMVYIGKTRADMIPQSFFWDASDQTLYVNIGGDPGWFCMEVGVRGFALTAQKVHDVVIRGLEMRHNRQPGGQWPLVAVGNSERVTVEDCRVNYGDFAGLSLGSSKNCTVRRCDVSNNGAIGITMGVSEDCLVEDCKLMFNNYRHFYGDWGVSAGSKCIPGNKRITFRGCEAAYNTEAEGIWFDTDNEDIRLLGNICHDNGDCGIFFEINKGGGTIAGNLIYNNHGRGIYVSGSEKTWVVNNTLADNASGIVAMTRGAGELPRRAMVFNNLLLRNYVVGETTTRGSDLTLETPLEPAKRADYDTHADYNVYANNTWVPFMRHNWNDNNTLQNWQKVYDQDKHSRMMKVDFEQGAGRFKLVTRTGLDVAGPIPDAVAKVWKPKNPKQVGCDLMQWP